jgi:hypothetical protein
MPKMNLYLVLALALGAATPAPIAPPAAHVITKRSERAAVCAVEHRLQPVRISRLKPGLHRASIARVVVLTGSATPRAPAAV